jgi:hypothetical protein
MSHCCDILQAPTGGVGGWGVRVPAHSYSQEVSWWHHSMSQLLQGTWLPLRLMALPIRTIQRRRMVDGDGHQWHHSRTCPRAEGREAQVTAKGRLKEAGRR